MQTEPQVILIEESTTTVLIARERVRIAKMAHAIHHIKRIYI